MINLTKILVLTAVLLVVFSLIFFLAQKPPTVNAPSETVVSEFNADENLADLDETDLDSLDAELNKLDQDASGF